jgi:hypothetical protein
LRAAARKSWAAAGGNTFAGSRLCRAKSLFAPQRLVVQRQEIPGLLLVFGVQVVEQSGPSRTMASSISSSDLK